MKYLKTYKQIINEISNNENLTMNHRHVDCTKIDDNLLIRCVELMDKFGKQDIEIGVTTVNIPFSNSKRIKIFKNNFNNIGILDHEKNNTNSYFYTFYNNFSNKSRNEIKDFILDPDLEYKLESNKLGLL